MNYAYDELYVRSAQTIMGDMLDFSVNTLNFPLTDFYTYFLISNISRQFGIGNPTYVAGMNGCEVARQVLDECGVKYPNMKDIMYVDKSEEYWIGWSLAYYQWKVNKSFDSINECVPIETMRGMYRTLHEADISTFVDVIDEKCHKMQSENAIKRFRAYAQLSQSQLAQKSGVALRQIQMFEQGHRDIHKTQGETLMRLAQALHCRMEDLL